MTSLHSIVDGALDAAVVPGYTRLGYRLRAATWEDIPSGAMQGRTVVITGATSGMESRTIFMFLPNQASAGRSAHPLAVIH